MMALSPHPPNCVLHQIKHQFDSLQHELKTPSLNELSQRPSNANGTSEHLMWHKRAEQLHLSHRTFVQFIQDSSWILVQRFGEQQRNKNKDKNDAEDKNAEADDKNAENTVKTSFNSVKEAHEAIQKQLLKPLFNIEKMKHLKPEKAQKGDEKQLKMYGEIIETLFEVLEQKQQHQEQHHQEYTSEENMKKQSKQIKREKKQQTRKQGRKQNKNMHTKNTDAATKDVKTSDQDVVKNKQNVRRDSRKHEKNKSINVHVGKDGDADMEKERIRNSDSKTTYVTPNECNEESIEEMVKALDEIADNLSKAPIRTDDAYSRFSQAHAENASVSKGVSNLANSLSRPSIQTDSNLSSHRRAISFDDEDISNSTSATFRKLTAIAKERNMKSFLSLLSRKVEDSQV